MNNYFTYSILQYKHSLALGEVLNVGILFYFPDNEKFEFVNGDAHRLKSVYPDFDHALFNSYLKTIQLRTKKNVELFNQGKANSDFVGFIRHEILASDAAGLVFSPPVQVKNIFSSKDLLIEQYSKQLLPGINIEKPTIVKHNERYILRTFNGYILKKDKSLENRFLKDKIIQTNRFKYKFELVWEKDSVNYIKPVSFDLSDELQIQNKAAQQFGFITDLADYADTHNARFDFLISQPKNPSLKRSFDNAFDFLHNTKGNRKLLTDEYWESYSEEVVEAFL